MVEYRYFGTIIESSNFKPDGKKIQSMVYIPNH